MKRIIISFIIVLSISSISCDDYLDDLALQSGLNEGLVAYWPMNEQYPDPITLLTNEAKDYSGNNNDLELLNTTDGLGIQEYAYSVTGKFNTAYQFDDSKYAYANLYKTNLLKGSNEFSISLWIKDTTSMLPIITTQGFSLSSDNLTDISLTIKKSGVGPYPIAESYPAWTTSGKWTYVVGTYDKKNICLYVNGNLLAKTPCTDNLIQTNRLVICTNLDQVDYEPCRTATLDEIRIYNRAISQDEIKALMDIGMD